MADTGLQMNFAALKRTDPYAREIIDSASHVALYTFVENEWEKTSIEGALFVYSRNGEPYHSLIIMNRLNTNNLIEPVSKGIEMQLREPFILYRNAKCRIFGIWFYDKEECIRLAGHLSSIVQESSKIGITENMSQNPMYSVNTQSNAPVNIFSMLSKAQDDYNSNKGLTPNKTESTPSRAPDMTPQSVMDFFAKAGSGSAQKPPVVTSLPSPGIFCQQSATSSRDGPMLLQRLMSNPAHSVEHIEKQQRSATPQDGVNINGNVSFQVKSTPTDTKLLSIKKDSDTNGLITLENEMSLIHISSPKTNSPLATYLNQSHDTIHSVNTFDGGKYEDKLMFPKNSSANNPSKPALMPPTMFTASPNEKQRSPEPLTRNQLLQAFNYLLKNDADFVNKLHEGYVKSFS